MFYLTTNSTHFIFGYRTYSKGPHPSKYNFLAIPAGAHSIRTIVTYLAEILYMHNPTTLIVHILAFVTAVL